MNLVLLRVSLSLALWGCVAIGPRALAFQAPTAATQAASEEDRQAMMNVLGIKSLRRGADGRNTDAPNAANYDEAKANPYPKLPDPLVMKNGKAVRTAADWWKRRRPEIAEDFDREIYGRVPASTPAVSWHVTDLTHEKNGEFAVIKKQLTGTVNNSSYPQVSVAIQVVLVTPEAAKGPVPTILELGFTGGPQRATPTWQQDVLAKGWGYAVLSPTSVQADNGAGLKSGIIGLMNKGQGRKPDDWGALRAWAWGASRVLDYFETDKAVDAKKVAIEGHSRYGKAAAVAMAYDARFAAAFVSSSGEGGLKLHRRNWGELVENVAASNEYHWMAGNFLKYAGPLTWSDLPIDAHELVALCAPRPVFISAGATKGDGWVDAKGMFLAGAGAGPVYRLLGKKDMGTQEFPPIETGLMDGDVAFRQHAGGHTPGPNWGVFLSFADRYFGETALSAQARKVKIVRDDWGIAHVYGKTDADAVFGMIFAQAEDDFNRIETNYLNAMGRLAEAEGEARIIQDLRMKLFIDPETLKKQYAASPPWLKALMNAFADGLNYYLATHPGTAPRVIRHFEPWMALSFSEGSIGGDIERVNLGQLEAFYGKGPRLVAQNQVGALFQTEPSGSNGIAIAPKRTSGGHALLLINPHTSFFFRSELQVVSEEGLNAYGAATWGQFFIYQGFNERNGWMHTSSGVDVVDEYLESVTKRGDRFYYKDGARERPVTTADIVVPYRTGQGMAERKFTVYRTHHGPVIREADGRWVSIRLMQEPVKALMQSYLRTKTRDYASFRKTMELKANSSNNTIYADAGGTIAYFHGNFVPKRDGRFDWTKPVDGSDPATEWKGLHAVSETPLLLNPASGWLYNANNWPWSAAGASSPKKEAYPVYMESGRESARGLHAIRVLADKRDFTLRSLLDAAYDSYLPWFEKPLPALIRAWEQALESDPLKAKLADQIGILRTWDLRWGVASVSTSLAVFWGEEVQRRVRDEVRKGGGSAEDYLGSQASVDVMLQALAVASDRLAAEFGTWKTPWGDINRFQRLTGDIVQPFNDNGASIPVGFTSAIWGSLASFGARPYPGTKRWYGTSGNSFVAVVEFGERVHALAISAGGEAGSPKSIHFNDQAKRYSTGDLREVYFYREQLAGHIQREYHPGQ